MSKYTISKRGNLIRLTDERWQHIIERHAEMQSLQLEILSTVEEPDYIVQGEHEEFIAVRHLTDNKYIVVVYREQPPDSKENDGFIITAFTTRKIHKLLERERIWQTS
jgi:hypothetical protein